VSRDAAPTGVEDLLRDLAPQVLGAVVRRYGNLDDAEDATQEALIAAAAQWPDDGVPDNPRGWLIRVASRRMTDQIRSDAARRRREEQAATRAMPDQLLAPAADTTDVQSKDDSLSLLFMCCHPVLTPASAIALTLRAVGGLTTTEIAKAFFVPETTMAQRISRAKQRIKASDVPFEMPGATEWDGRLRAVLQVLYLIFNEGYTTSSGQALNRADLTTEAIRLARLLRMLTPTEAEVAGLLALMLLTDARRAARSDVYGSLIPLQEQDRGRWDSTKIAEGVELLTRTLGTAPVGPYQLQAAIAAVHDEAPSADETDWPQILALYEMLEQVSPGPAVTLNRAVALAMVHGPRAGLALLGSLDDDARMTQTHRVDATRAHLLELAGDTAAARAAYLRAARITASVPEQRYLALRAAALGDF
jgi:RNA polymerase sigma factor (sigma-70 family)